MNTRTFFALIAIGLVSLLTGCAVVPPHEEAGVNAPSTYKGAAYYKSHLKDVIAKAETGDAEAQFEVAFVTGWNGDVKTSNFWVEKAAAQDYLPALTVLCARKYDYSNWEYTKDNALAERLCYRAYDIYLSKPASEWGVFDKDKAAQALIKIGDKNLSEKDKAQDVLCKAAKIGIKDSNTTYVLNDDLKRIGRTCK